MPTVFRVLSYPYYLCLSILSAVGATPLQAFIKAKGRGAVCFAKQAKPRVAATDVLQSPLVVLKFFLCMVIKRTFSGNKELILTTYLCSGPS
jgi:hypothetical protein